jgi:hypothetical protein
MKSVLSTVAVLSVAAFGCACVVVDSQGHIARDEKRFTVAGTPELHVTTFDGAIEIRSGEGKEVVVEIEKRGPTQEAIDHLQVTATQDGNRVDVEVKKPSTDTVVFGIGHNLSASAKLTVTMPREGNVVARSGDGSIRIEHVSGKLELRTGDGSVHGTDVSGQVMINTGDGSVTLDGADGEVDVETGDGGVNIAGKVGVVKAHTGDGSVTFRAAEGSAMKDDWTITTGDGGVALYLPSDFGAQIDAHTGDGTIRSELQLNAGNDGQVSKRTVRARVGAGGKELKIRTGDGDIRLKVG